MSISDMEAWDREFRPRTRGTPAPAAHLGAVEAALFAVDQQEPDVFARMAAAASAAMPKLSADAKATLRLALRDVEQMRHGERHPDLTRQRLDAVRAELDRLP